MKKTDKDTKSFEHQIARLDEIVGLLDAGEEPLDILLALYEEGITLTKECRTYLEKAEQKIEELAGGA